MTAYTGAFAGSPVVSAAPLQHVWIPVQVRADTITSSAPSESPKETYRKGAVVTFIAKDSTGAPLPGAPTTWAVYKNAVTGVDQAVPSITDLGLGNYKFTLTGTEPAGILDLGSSAQPRYLTFVSVASIWVFAAFSLLGQPLAGLSPTWVSLKRASDGINYTPQPSINQIGGGLYKTDFLSERLTGVIDLGATASPRYIAYDTNRPTILVPLASEF